jgi:sugar O-acyltransferase (sialic acid O-acetyltransferase NeuD family)
MKPLIILGTGGSAYDVLDIVEAINAAVPTWSVHGFLDDQRPAGSRFLEWPVVGPLSAAGSFTSAYFINVIGSDRSFRQRESLVARTALARQRFATLIHPQAGVSSRSHLGAGVVVNFGASVAGNVTIGDHVSLGPGSIVGHDAQIGDFTVVAPGAVVSGFVGVGRSAYLGARSVIRQKLQVGDEALVGMGAVVIRDVPAAAVVVGNPARILEPALA